MDYELAKELKDAGFPQKHDSIRGQSLGFPGTVLVDAVKDSEAYAPTLSELIEACDFREVFFQLNYWPNKKIWFAEHPRAQGKGTTPEEAVARLWLAVHKSKSP